MSRIGNHPIPLPAKVEVTVGPGEITVKGPLGTLSRSYPNGLSIEKEGDHLVCKAANEEVNAMHGTLRAAVTLAVADEDFETAPQPRENPFALLQRLKTRKAE